MNATQTGENLSSYDVVILGAGYAGLMAALRLSRRKWRLRIALIGAREQFLERVRLQESIVVSVAPRISSIARFVAGTSIEFVCGDVVSLDAERRRIRIEILSICTPPRALRRTRDAVHGKVALITADPQSMTETLTRSAA